MSECACCGYASENGHAPHCLWGHTVKGPHDDPQTIDITESDIDTRETSREAYRSIAGDLPRLEGVVLEFIRRSDGATDDEIEAGTGLPHQTASARRNGLMRRGLIRVASNERGEPLKRQTRSGRKAFVWVAA